MKKSTTRTLSILSTIVVLVIIAWVVPRVLPTTVHLDAAVEKEILSEAQIGGSQPVLYALFHPSYRIRKFSETTVTVTGYTWFGIPLQDVVLSECKYNTVQHGTDTPPFSCMTSAVK